jgi:hypothetical protein
MKWNSKFIFQGKSLYYNRIGVNNWSERAVEIPIAFNFLAHLDRKEKILEVGNVLSNYENSLSEYLGLKPRRIVDKFEIDINVDNVDLMDIPSQEKYDAIVSISTVEHIGQGVAPSEAYGERITEHDLEAPLKAIAKIYDLLILGGKALITVPFGKLINWGWYIQFSWEYLELLETKYNVPSNAISKVFMKRLALQITQNNNPPQIWLEEKKNSQLLNVACNWPWPGANAIAILELTKIDEKFSLNVDSTPSPLFYQTTNLPSPVIKADLLEDDFLLLLDKLRDINIIFSPDWLQPENLLFSDLEKIIQVVFNHPDKNSITLLIDSSNCFEEDAELTLSGVIMNMFIELNIDFTNGLEISLIGKLSNLQWSALLPQIHYQITLENKNTQIISNSRTETLPICPLDAFINKRIFQLETGALALN